MVCSDVEVEPVLQFSLLATHDRLFAKKEKRSLEHRMSQRHKLDSKASGEKKVKSFKR